MHVELNRNVRRRDCLGQVLLIREHHQRHPVKLSLLLDRICTPKTKNNASITAGHRRYEYRADDDSDYSEQDDEDVLDPAIFDDEEDTAEGGGGLHPRRRITPK